MKDPTAQHRALARWHQSEASANREMHRIKQWDFARSGDIEDLAASVGARETANWHAMQADNILNPRREPRQ